MNRHVPHSRTASARPGSARPGGIRAGPAWMLAVLLAAGLAAGCGPQGEGPMSAKERAAKADTIQTLVQEFVRRWNQLEPGPYARLYSEDMQFYFRGARLAKSRSGFEKKVRDLMAGYESYTITPTDPQIRVLGPEAAVASFTYAGQAVDTTGSSRNVQAAITLLYEREEGDWTISLAHESVAPPEQSE